MARGKSSQAHAGTAGTGGTGGSGGTDGSGGSERTAGAGGQPRVHHGNRHGRSEAARRAVLEAADDLLVEKGFAGVTMEGIASRAGVAKQTIYRWWPSRTDVLMDAFLRDAAEDLVPPDFGDLGRELRAHMRRLAWFLGESDAGAVFRALIGQAQHDREFAAHFRSRFFGEQRRRDRLPLERAVQRGELTAGVDVEAETDQLVGPVYYRVLVAGEPVGRDFCDRLVAEFLRRGTDVGTVGRR